MEPNKVLEFTVWLFFTPLDIERYTVVNNFVTSVFSVQQIAFI